MVEGFKECTSIVSALFISQFHKMTIRSNKNRLSPATEKHLCEYLVSPFCQSGLRSYKARHNLSFPEPTKQVSNRLFNLKKLYKSNVVDFATLCKSYGINSSVSSTPVSFFDDSSVSTKSTSKSLLPTASTTFIKCKMNSNSSLPEMREHQTLLNMDHPHLKRHGMLWFRDDDVRIDGSLCSILTIYQPLFDARDVSSVKLSLDNEESDLIHHIHPNVPSFFYKDCQRMHKLEDKKDNKNPELFSMTEKKHQKCAIKIKTDENHRLQRDSYRLPFTLSLEKFDAIDNAGSELKKNYRILEIEVTDKIKHKVSYVYWKVLIDGETTHLSSDTDPVFNEFEEAEARMSAAFADMNVG